MSEQEARGLLAKFDKKYISVEEFVSVIRSYRVPEKSTILDETVNKSTQMSGDPILKSFKFLDTKNSGKLGVNSFKYLLTNYGNKFSNEEVQFLFEYMKLEGKNDFDYIDFVDKIKTKTTEI